MGLVRKEVKSFQVQYVCDSCNEGYMEPKGPMLMTHPPLYPHRCRNCDVTMNLKHAYPIVEMEVA